MGADPRRVRTAVALFATVVAGALVVPAALGTPDATCAAAGEIRVRVVVDFGPSSPVSDVCVPVADRSTGAELLAARARQLGTPPPRFENGFVCAIDGFPETGCGERTSDGYRYWSYWHGQSGSWAYSNIGAAGWKLRDGDVDGWHFLDGGPESKATPPRGNAAPCPAAAPPTNVTPTTIVTTTTTTTTTAAATTTTTTTTTTTSSGFGQSGGVSSESVPETGGTALASRRLASDDDDDNGPPVGLLIVAAAVVALGTAAAVRFRRRGDG